MTIIAIKIIDRVGRKPMLFAGVAGMVTSLLVLGIANAALATPHHASDPTAIITLICLATFIASFAATWGPVVWVMIPEVLPLSVRGTAMGVAVFCNWGANSWSLRPSRRCSRASAPDRSFSVMPGWESSPRCS
jgi:MFS family permease